MESVKVKSVLIKKYSGQKPAAAGLVPARAATSPARAAAAKNIKNAVAEAGIFGMQVIEQETLAKKRECRMSK